MSIVELLVACDGERAVQAKITQLGYDQMSAVSFRTQRPNTMAADHPQEDPLPTTRARRPRNYFSRREQYRLLSLVFMLLLVTLLMFEAAKPKNWQWMWQLGSVPANDSLAEDSDIDALLPSGHGERLPADVFISPPRVPDDATDSNLLQSRTLPRIAALDLSQVRDDTVFRAQESEAWYGILGALADSDAKLLDTHSVGQVGFTQLFRQAEEYRGQVVNIRGVLRRAFSLRSGTNEEGIVSYWQCWLQPDGSQNPVVVYLLELPHEFPDGMSLNERVDITGVFFKRWAYAAKEGTRTAPLVLANQLQWTKTPVAAVKKPPQPSQMFAVAAAALLAALFVTWIVYARTKPKRRPPDVHLRGDAAGSLPKSLTGWLLVMGLLLSATAEAQEEPPPIESTAAAVESIADFLQLYNLDRELLESLGEASRGETLDEASQIEFALRLFQCLRRCPPNLVEREAISWSQENDAEHLQAGQLVRLRAQLKQIESIHVTDELRQRFHSAQLFRCRCRLSDSEDSKEFTLLANKIPQRWLPLIALREFGEQITCTAVVLSSGNPGDVVLQTDRIAWHPTATDTQFEIETDHVLLARHGMDIGQLDEVKPKGRLSVHDRAAFYQMLLATARIPSSEVMSVSEQVNVTDLLQDSESHRGKFYRIEGTARRCVKILVDEDQLREHQVGSYYELVVFQDPDALVKIRSKEDDTGKYFTTYPVVVCVRTLPDRFPQGEDIQAAVRVTGSYLKLWAYPSEFMQSDGGQALQFSPLLIGDKPQLINPPTARDPFHARGFAIAFAVSLIGLAALIWWWGRGDDKFKRETLTRKYELPPNVQLDQEGFETTGEPRFDD